MVVNAWVLEFRILNTSGYALSDALSARVRFGLEDV